MGEGDGGKLWVEGCEGSLGTTEDVNYKLLPNVYKFK